MLSSAILCKLLSVFTLWRRREGVRTPDTLSGMPVFDPGAIDRSATSPPLIVVESRSFQGIQATVCEPAEKESGSRAHTLPPVCLIPVYFFSSSSSANPSASVNPSRKAWSIPAE